MSRNVLKKKIVVIGGGTGTYTVLSGLKKYPVELTAIVSMADDGGSNKVIRDEFGLLPTSDIRLCFVALAEGGGEVDRLMRNLFMHRFASDNRMRGMTFGNLFMAALTDILGSQKDAIGKTHKILKVQGKVLPVTFGNARLVATYENGHKVVGEHFIDEPEGHDGRMKIKNIILQPSVRANPEAIRAVRGADLVVIGPGDLYTSIIPNFLVKGMREAVRHTPAKVAYVMNLMTKFGQTDGFTASDHVNVLARYLGKHTLDVVVVNSKPVPKQIMMRYRREREFPVVDDLRPSDFQILRRALIGEKRIPKIAGDVLKRSFVRHDPDILAKALITLL